MNNTENNNINEYPFFMFFILSKYYYLSIGIILILLTIFFLIYLNYNNISSKMEKIYGFTFFKSLLGLFLTKNESHKKKIYNEFKKDKKYKYKNKLEETKLEKETKLKQEYKQEYKLISKNKLLDNKYYDILIKIYNAIGAVIIAPEQNEFNEIYILKLNEANNILFDIKRNIKLTKSNYILDKIIDKLSKFKINSDDLNDVIIYLLVIQLNDKL